MLRDEAYLLDILIAARKALRFTQGLTKEEFLQDDLLQNAAMRVLSIAGEAARMVSYEFKRSHPQVPWAKIVRLRHRLIHEYFRIDLDEVWFVVKSELAELIRIIEPLVPPESAI